MVLVSLPVSSFSKKIILADYGQCPVRLVKGDELLHLLCYRRPSRKEALSLQGLLNDQLEVMVGRDVSQCIAGAATGWFLYHHHIHLMMVHVRASLICGKNAKEAIEDFYTMHGLCEDDFSFESAYKRWQRFQVSKQLAKSARKINNRARPGGGKIDTAHSRHLVPPTDAAVEAFRARFILENPTYLYSRSGQLRKRAEKQLDCYLSLRIAKRSAASLARAWACSYYNVFYSSRQFELALYSDKLLSFRFYELLKEMLPDVASMKGRA